MNYLREVVPETLGKKQLKSNFENSEMEILSTFLEIS